tara:strand:+ start:208 stop:855 length:648 start_codon:yes stop_codon:yes gene_type:complete
MQKDWLKTTKGMEYKKREAVRADSDESRAHRAELQRKQRKSLTGQEYKQSQSYKDSKKREYDKMKEVPGAKAMHYIQVAIGDATKGRRGNHYSSKIEQWTEFDSLEDLRMFFSERFEEGMTWDNHSHTGWNIGHRIAKAHYNFANDEDVKRCWKKLNLFPQWATGENGNCSLRTKFPREAELMALRSCWPTAWNDVLPTIEQRRAMERICDVKCV